jgi:hypothetical protein
MTTYTITLHYEDTYDVEEVAGWLGCDPTEVLLSSLEDLVRAQPMRVLVDDWNFVPEIFIEEN